MAVRATSSEHFAQGDRLSRAHSYALAGHPSPPPPTSSHHRRRLSQHLSSLSERSLVVTASHAVRPHRRARCLRHRLRRGRARPCLSRDPGRTARGAPPRQAPRRGRRRRKDGRRRRACCCRSRATLLPVASAAGSAWSSSGTMPTASASQLPAARRASTCSAGGRCPSTRMRSGRRRGRACRGSSSSLLAAPGLDADEAERRAFRARKRAERSIASYVASLSFRTVTYKALCAADQLAAFYADLRDPALEVPFGVFHQRFSTNTAPSWERAQPFRLLCHNGEINAIQGNVNWMHAREGRLGSDDDALLAPVVDPRGSDSAMLDNVLELLVRGRPRRPPLAGDARPGGVGGERRARPGGARLLPLPLRALRAVGRAGRRSSSPTAASSARRSTATGCVRSATRSAATSSSARRRQAWPICPRDPVRRGQARAGRDDRDRSRARPRGERARSSGGWRRAPRTASGSRAVSSAARAARRSAAPETDLTPRQAAFGYTQEDLRAILRPTASHAHEPTSSMGDDTALAPLAGRARPLYSYFRQRFAQVTNPPIDHLRERFVFSLRTLLGGRSPILVESPEAAGGIELRELLPLPGRRSHGSTPSGSTRPSRRTRGSRRRSTGSSRRPRRPCAPAAGCCCSPTPPQGPTARRSRCCSRSAPCTTGSSPRSCARSRRIVVESDEPREVHHVACLLGYGAEAICPRLALETVAALAAATSSAATGPSPDEAQERFRRAIEDGVLKVMSKMGISDVASYCGAQLFDVVGLAHEVVDRCFAGTSSRVGGLGFAELERDVLERHARAWAGRRAPREPGLRQVPQGRRAARDRPRGRRGAPRDGRRAHALRKAVRDEDRERYERFAELVNAREPLELRDLLELVPAGGARAARRGRAGRVDRPALLQRRHVPRRAVRGGARDGRDRVQPARRPRELRRGRRGPGALRATSATAGSSRSRPAASASRRSTRLAPTSCRSRSRRARSRARAASSRATR